MAPTSPRLMMQQSQEHPPPCNNNYNNDIIVFDRINVNNNNDDGGEAQLLSSQITEAEAEVAFSSSSWRWIKVISGLLVIAFITYVIVDSLTTKYISNSITDFLHWVSSNIYIGSVVYILVYFIATIALLPGSILTLGAGFIFGNAVNLGGGGSSGSGGDDLAAGVALASCIVFIGASAGAIVSFLIARYLLRDWVTTHLLQNNNYPILLALDNTFGQKGYTIFLLLRLSPIIPFNVMNYIGGVTSIKFRHYVLSLFGILPGTVLYCFIGATTGNLLAGSTTGTTTTEEEEEEGGSGGSSSVASSPATLAATVIGIMLGLAALFVISYYAKKEFNKIVLLSQQQKQEEEEQPEEENNEHEQEEEESGLEGRRDGVVGFVNSYHNS